MSEVMPLVEFYDAQTSRVLIKPKYAKDKALFEHCANGLISITRPHFMGTVRHVLGAHGMDAVITDRIENTPNRKERG